MNGLERGLNGNVRTNRLSVLRFFALVWLWAVPTPSSASPALQSPLHKNFPGGCGDCKGVYDKNKSDPMRRIHVAGDVDCDSPHAEPADPDSTGDGRIRAFTAIAHGCRSAVIGTEFGARYSSSVQRTGRLVQVSRREPLFRYLGLGSRLVGVLRQQQQCNTGGR